MNKGRPKLLVFVISQHSLGGLVENVVFFVNMIREKFNKEFCLLHQVADREIMELAIFDIPHRFHKIVITFPELPMLGAQSIGRTFDMILDKRKKTFLFAFAMWKNYFPDRADCFGNRLESFNGKAVGFNRLSGI